MHNSVNKLFRWKAISDEFLKHSNSGLPTSRIYANYIYPKFFISKRTLDTILSTNINRELKAAGYTDEDVSEILNKHNSSQISNSFPQGLSGTISSNPYLKPLNHNQIF